MKDNIEYGKAASLARFVIVGLWVATWIVIISVMVLIVGAL